MALAKVKIGKCERCGNWTTLFPILTKQGDVWLCDKCKDLLENESKIELANGMIVETFF